MKKCDFNKDSSLEFGKNMKICDFNTDSSLEFGKNDEHLASKIHHWNLANDEHLAISNVDIVQHLLILLVISNVVGI